MLKPTLDRVAIRREKREEVTKGGIYLPDKAQKKTNFGVVLAVGPGGFNADGSRRPIGVKKGDKVFFTESPYHIDSLGEDIIVADEEDILAVV